MGFPYINFECHLFSTAIIEVPYLDKKFSIDQIFYVVTKLAGVQVKLPSLLTSKIKIIFFVFRTYYMLLNDMCYLSRALLYFFPLNFSKVKRQLTFFESNLFMTYILYTSCCKIVMAFMSNMKFYVNTLNIALQWKNMFLFFCNSLFSSFVLESIYMYKYKYTLKICKDKIKIGNIMRKNYMKTYWYI